MVKHVFGEFLRLFVHKAFANPLCVEAGFVHSHKSDCGKVVAESAEVTLCVGIQSRFHKLRDGVALYFQRTCGNVHQFVQTLVEFLFVFGKVGNTGHVDGYYAHRTGAFAASEKSAGFFAQFTQIQTQTAAHTAHVAGLHVAVDVVGEVRRAVLSRHFKQQLVVFRFAPIEIFCYGIGGNGILETTTVVVAFNHRFDEGFVYHVHFLLAVFVLEVHFLSAHNAVEFRKVVGNGPVKRYVGKWCLRTPTAGRVDAVNEGLYALLYFFIRKTSYEDDLERLFIKIDKDQAENHKQYLVDKKNNRLQMKKGKKSISISIIL